VVVAAAVVVLLGAAVLGAAVECTGPYFCILWPLSCNI
jgi:hypothetical protein